MIRPTSAGLQDYFLERVDTDAENPSCVVILIHGTGARHEAWTRVGAVRDQIRGHVPGAHIYRYEWSGDNSHLARLEAEEALRELIKERLQKDPVVGHLDIFLVAHSHGGNVALYAMNDVAIRAAVKGVVCLGTPFLVVIPTPGQRAGVNGLVNWIGGPIFLLMAAALIVIAIIEHPWAGSAWIAGVVIAGALLLRTLSKHGHKFPLNKMHRQRNGPAKDLEKRLVLPQLAPEKMRILSAIADEADGGLSAALMFAWIGRKIIALRDRFAKRVMAIVMVVFGVVAIADVFFGDRMPDSVGDIGALVLGVMVLGLAAVGVVVNSLLVYLPNCAFGWDAMAWSRRRQTSAEESPPGLSHIIQLKFDRSADEPDKKAGLRHSEVCWRKEAITEIVGFIRERRGLPPIADEAEEPGEIPSS